MHKILRSSVIRETVHHKTVPRESRVRIRSVSYRAYTVIDVSDCVQPNKQISTSNSVECCLRTHISVQISLEENTKEIHRRINLSYNIKEDNF